MAAGAEELARRGSTETLDVRRAQAVGDLARRQPTLDLDHAADTGESGIARAATRTVVLHVHLSEAEIGGHYPVARVDNAGGVRLVTAQQVRERRRPETRVVVRPVLDLADHISVDAYEVPDVMAERARAARPTCVFPRCSRTARRCHLDHGVPWPHGPTADDNLAPLCRLHHRLKTHGGWIYTRLDETSLLWRSPHGLRFLRDHTGTRDVSLVARSSHPTFSRPAPHPASTPPAGPSASA